MTLFPHLHFAGDCREAFSLYADALGGRIVFAMTFGEVPGDKPVPPQVRDQICHARLEFPGGALAGCDVPPERYHRPRGFNVLVSIGEPREAERLFGTLARGGEVAMPFAQTFWAHRFGMCTDRFGIPWMVNCEKDG